MNHKISKLIAIAAMVGALASCNEDPVLPPTYIPPGGVESIGDGSWEHPIDSYQILRGFQYASDPNKLVWGMGYIVGYINTDASPTFSLEEKSARFTAEGAGSSNLLISYAPDVTDWTQCASVRLTDSDARNYLNLKDHPENLGKQVCIYGKTAKYCGVYGMRDLMAYKLDSAVGYPVEPPKPVVDATFTKVSDVDGDGEYLVVFEDKYLTTLLTPTSYSYGELPTAQVTPADGTLVASTANAYTFTKTEGGWTIKDSANRYVWWDSDPSHNSFQLTTSEGSEGMVWTVTPQTNGTVEIKNVQFGRTWSFNSSKNTVSAYTGVQTKLPVLYKR